MDILLQHNRAYRWHEENGVAVRGYFQRKDAPDTVLRDAAAAAYFAAADSFDAFLALLAAVDGVFAVVMRPSPDTTWAAVDRARSMPLYYATDGSAISDDSKQLREHLGIAAEDTDALRMAELMTACSVSDRYTVYEKLRQLPMGTAAEWSGSALRTAFYYRHLSPVREYSREAATAALRQTAERVIDNILKVVGDRPIALSLSGGYDSRFLACMLKERGAENVSCYTYGDKSSFEVVQSKKVAEALGYRWICVTYTDEDVAGQLDETDYIDACFQHDFITYLQNYIAVKRLHEEGWFPENAVFLTGLCHDMPTGAYVKKPEDIRYPVSADGVAAYTLDYRFVRYHLKKDAREAYLADLRRQIDALGKKVETFQDFVQVADALNTGFEHSRQFLAMNHSHEFFGYEWLLPCWDQALLDFWYSLPYTLRIHQNLYEEWLLTDLCKKYGVGTKKTLNLHTPYPWLSAIVRQAGGVAAWFCFKTHIPLRLRTDINGGATLRQRLYDGIVQKRAIKYSRASQLLLQALYFMEKRYGTQFWQPLRKILKK